MLDPAPDGDMIHRNPALGHHLLQVAVAQRIPQVPPHAQNDDDIVKVSPSERRWSGPAHRITLPEVPEPFATDPYRLIQRRSRFPQKPTVDDLSRRFFAGFNNGDARPSR